ncbi:MAG TPA: hypothetical protein ENN46_02160 [Candidatus Woesearchaeota archaeon]|nr:hypothetical protein [Candidatus Woesearchaeota archaeon]
MPYQIETEADNIINIIKEKGSISVDDLSKICKIKKDILENTLQLLEQLGFVKIDYKLTNTIVSLKSDVKPDSRQQAEKASLKDMPDTNTESSFDYMPKEADDFFSGAKAQLNRFIALETNIASIFIKITIRALVSSILPKVLPEEERNIFDKEIAGLCEKANEKLFKMIYSLNDRQILDFYESLDSYLESLSSLYSRTKERISAEEDSLFNNLISTAVLFKLWGFKKKAFLIQMDEIRESIKNKDLQKTKLSQEKAISLINTGRLYNVNPILGDETASYMNSLKNLANSSDELGFSDEILNMIIPSRDQFNDQLLRLREDIERRSRFRKTPKKEKEELKEELIGYEDFESRQPGLSTFPPETEVSPTQDLAQESASGSSFEQGRAPAHKDAIESLSSALKNLKEASLESSLESGQLPEKPKQMQPHPQLASRQKEQAKAPAKPGFHDNQLKQQNARSQKPGLGTDSQGTVPSLPESLEGKPGSESNAQSKNISIQSLPDLERMNKEKIQKKDKEHFLLKKLSLSFVESERLFSEDRLNESLEKLERIKKACRILSQGFFSEKALELGKKASELEDKIISKFLRDNKAVFSSIFSTVKAEIEAMEAKISLNQLGDFAERYQKIKKVVFEIPELFPEQKIFFKHKLLGCLVKFQIAETRNAIQNERTSINRFKQLSGEFNTSLEQNKVESALVIYDELSRLVSSMETSRVKLRLLSDSNSLYERLLYSLEKKAELDKSSGLSFLLRQLSHIEELVKSGRANDARAALKRFFQTYSSMPFFLKEDLEAVKQKVFELHQSLSMDYASEGSLGEFPGGLENV